MSSDPGQRLRDPLGFPVWLGLWIALIAAWLSMMLLSHGQLGEWSFQLPRSANVYGYDGFVHAMYERYGSRIPPFGGWRGNIIPIAVIGLIAVSACVVTWRKPRWVIGPAAAVPIALLVLAIAAIILNLAGWWDGWICTGTDVRHYGQRLSRPQWRHVLPLVGSAYLIAGLCVTAMVGLTSHAAVKQRWIGAAAVAAIAIWVSTILLDRSQTAFHSAQVLAEATLFWCLTSQVIISGTQWFGRDEPIGVTRYLLRTGRWSHGILHVLLYILGPFVTAVAVRWHTSQWYETNTFVWLPWYLLAVFISLQWLDLDAQRFTAQHLHHRPTCLNCRYDLRGSVAAERRACPECGEPISDAQYAWLRDHVDEITA